MRYLLTLVVLLTALSGLAHAERKKVIITDPTGQFDMKLDRHTGALQTVDYAHHEIHSGSHFYISSHTTLASGADVAFGLQTPDSTKWTHLIFEYASTGQTDFDVYEDATYSGGSAVGSFNSNRNSGKTTGMTIVSDPTVTSSGTWIVSHSGGVTGNAVQTKGTGTSRDSELILKSNSKYLFVFTSGSDSNIVSYDAYWYEHTDTY